MRPLPHAAEGLPMAWADVAVADHEPKDVLPGTLESVEKRPAPEREVA